MRSKLYYIFIGMNAMHFIESLINQTSYVYDGIAWGSLLTLIGLIFLDVSLNRSKRDKFVSPSKYYMDKLKDDPE